MQAVHLHVSVGEATGAYLAPGEYLNQKQWTPLEQGRLPMEMPGCSWTLSAGPPQAGPAITAMAIGCLTSATGGLLYLLRWVGGCDGGVPMGLMLVLTGLVWIPVLREKQRRKLQSGWE